MFLPSIKLLSERTEQEKIKAEKKHQESHDFLQKLSQKEENRECADCTNRYPGWAVLPHGIFVCIHCAQIHRGIGRHISQVKGVSTGTYLWYPDEIEAMSVMGNAKAAEMYLGGASHTVTKPKKDDPQHIKEQYIKNKYENKLWIKKDSPPPSVPKKNVTPPKKTVVNTPSGTGGLVTSPRGGDFPSISPQTSSSISTNTQDFWDEWAPMTTSTTSSSTNNTASNPFSNWSSSTISTPTNTTTTTTTKPSVSFDPWSDWPTPTKKISSPTPTNTTTTTTTTKPSISFDPWSDWPTPTKKMENSEKSGGLEEKKNFDQNQKKDNVMAMYNTQPIYYQGGGGGNGVW